MNLEVIREQIDLIDVKAVKVRQGLNRLLSGLVTDASGVLLTSNQKTDITAECLNTYAEIKDLIAEIDSELSRGNRS